MPLVVVAIARPPTKWLLFCSARNHGSNGTVSKKKKSSRPKPETEGPPPAKKKEKKSGIDLMAIADDVVEVSVTKAAGSGGLDLTEKEDEDDADFGDLLGKVTKS